MIVNVCVAVMLEQFKHDFFLYFLQNKYKEKYTTDMKGHYEDSGIDKKTMHAMKARKLASDVSLVFIWSWITNNCSSPSFFQ